MKKLKISKSFATNKLRIPKKQVSAAIAFALMLTIAVTLVALPIAYAHTPAWTIATFAFVAPAPNPIGVGQTGTIVMWLDKVPPTAFWQFGDRYEGFMLEITKPNGGKDTLGPYESDDIGGISHIYTPTEAGTYHLKFSYPGQTLAGKNPPLNNPDG